MDRETVDPGKAAKHNARSGAALGMALLALAVFSILGVGLMNLATVNGIQTERSISEIKAFWVAEAGLAKARALAVKYARPFNEILGVLQWTDSFGGDSYQVRILPDASNEFSRTKRYEIVSTGTTASGGSQTVRQLAEISSTFASYMHASASEETSSGSNIFFGPGDRLDGPVYVNDQINLFGGSPNPRFLQLVSSTANSVNYQNRANSSSFEGGLRLNAPPLNFTNVDHVANIRTGAQTGGLELTGDYAIAFTNASTNAYIVSRRWNGSSYDAAISNLLSDTNFNGTIYVSGAVREIGGTLDGNVTIACATTIRITTNLVYESAPANATLFSPSYTNVNVIDDSLGLVARDGVEIMGASAINIHAAILVTQGNAGFSANRNSWPIGQPYINLYGSISQFRRGIVGYVDGRGFRKNYKYDTRFDANPPKFFPYSTYSFSAWRQS